MSSIWALTCHFTPKSGRGSHPCGPESVIVTIVNLNDLEKDILDFERTWWTEPGPKEIAMVERFDLSMSQYYEVLNRLIDSEDALSYDPLVVRRLRRLRDRRRQARHDAVSESPAN